MVDVTFPFVLLLGGALVGIVTSVVRRHGALRTVLDVLAGTLGGFAGTPLWIAFVTHILPLAAPPPEEMSGRTAFLLSDIYYLSPVIGGFLGVGVLALIYRYVLGRRRDEPWLAGLGDLLGIVGFVYLTIALCLSIALLVLAAANSRWEMISPGALALDSLAGVVLILAGRALKRLAGRPRTQGSASHEDNASETGKP